MNRIKSITLPALIVAAGLTGMTASAAQAGGSISFNVTPKNAQEETAIRIGLAIYGIANAVKSGAIKQKGNGNAAGLAQYGSGNFGVVHQEGNGHSGSLVQNGNQNAYGIFQFGKGSNAHVAQNGNGGTGATFAFGW